MEVVNEFDPWGGELCTCPNKYSLNPYTGCGHRCIYCYATYIPNFFRPRRKKNLVERIERDLERIPSGSIISLSNSSDPYTPMDEEHQDTRNCLEAMKGYNLRILLVTKSDLVLRDMDLLRDLKSAVTLTITALKKEVHRKLEPNAPSPHKRLEAMRELEKEGIPTGLRLDPIFPELTGEESGEIIEKAEKAGVRHVVTSTFKPRKDGWNRFRKAFPDTAERVKPLYFQSGEKIGNSWYLPEKIRKRVVEKVKEECLERGIDFATCREGFSEMRTAGSCDGSHLIEE
ncbi:radical SAM protein [candidate division MSBL1 archaeon SCGC-AAA259O05]|uniref:Radical SAM protein n=1 Tax=candidate division MSBL1 archaeon SCGC-AAA259O05 TaxID=1698271 RepID=A0A133V3H4_9EURY|nr:radical SAM protein [candidate division MSBL1 archaeon SCGC-AAA259O05]